MTEVVLHIYDVTNSASAKTNNVIVQLNKIMKDGIGIGGIFHSAVQIYGEEWSFGYCENGTGVFNCPPKQNPMYTYRESIVLGKTNLSATAVTHILTELSRDWPGYTYDLLAKNCNHFCDKFCEELGVQKLPAWVNRFANAGDAAVEVAESTAVRLRQAKADIVTASKVAYRFLTGGTSTPAAEDQVSVQAVRSANGSSGGFQVSWLKNITSFRSSGSSQDPSAADHIQDQRSKESAGLFQRGNSFADSV
uniref:PPPDE domain-containing protein n=1 Tax=Araucaria cunninghamii TaxID=56994 RepID=A0A0D6QW82_ARACU